MDDPSIFDAEAVAPPPPAGKVSPSLPPLPLSPVSATCCPDAAAAMEPGSNKKRVVSGTAAAMEPGRNKKRAVSGTEYELVAARLCRRRTRARPVVDGEAPASSTKWDPNISAAAASGDTTKKQDPYGGGETDAAPGAGGGGDAADAAAMEARSNKKRSTEDEIVATRLCRTRTPARPVVTGGAPASSATKRDPNISAAAALGNITKKGDRHGDSESVVKKKSSVSARAAAGEAPGAGGGGDGLRIGSLRSYKKICLLGEGGMGIVCKARDTRTGDLVAIKSGKTKGDAAALLREAALHTAACQGNPYVVGFREVVRGQGPDDVHLVMDFPGRSLRDLIDTGRLGPRFTESETRDAMKQLFAGVEKMGAQGIVHGDLKPENLLLSKNDGRYMVCDFGLAISIAAPPCNLEGTLWYSAPEQLLGENCGPAVDAWALGWIMAELLTGLPLVRAYHSTEQLSKIIFMLAVPDEVTGLDFEVDKSTPSELRNMVPEDLLTPAGFDVLQGLLQYEPESRLTPMEALKMPWFAEVGQP